MMWRFSFGPIKRLLVGMAACLNLTACASQFGETHYLKTTDDTGRVVNIFRLTVSGDTELSNVRFLSGYYDERAIDLFFNEVNAGDLSTQGVKPIFADYCEGAADAAACQAMKERKLSVSPLGATPDNNKAFFMVLSTNADAIADTIGSFAQNQTVVGAMVGLATLGPRTEAAKVAASEGPVAAQRAAAFAELGAVMTKINADTGAATTDDDYRRSAYLTMLRTIAGGIAPNSAPSFTTLQEADKWFAAQPRN
jgi:hypothetical protein